MKRNPPGKKPQTRPQMTADFRAMCAAQALDLVERMHAAGQLPPPPELVEGVTPESARRALQALSAALLPYAQKGPLDRPRHPQQGQAAQFINGIYYGWAMLQALERAEADPVNVVTLFAGWAGVFRVEVLTDDPSTGGGMTEGEARAALDRLEAEPQFITELLGRLPDSTSRGAFMAAQSLSMIAGEALFLEGSDPDALALRLQAHALLLSIEETMNPRAPGVQA